MTSPVSPSLPVLRQLLNEATSGPWFAWDRGVGWHIAVENPAGPTEDQYGRPRLLPEGDKTDLARGEDAALIVAAVNALPQLLAAIEAVQEMHRPIREATDDVDWCQACTTTWPCATAVALSTSGITPTTEET